MSKLTRYLLDAALAKDALHEVMPVGGGETPTEVWGWRDRRGHLQRARADYPNGWRIEIFFSKPRNGKVHVTSTKASMRIKIAGKVTA